MVDGVRLKNGALLRPRELVLVAAKGALIEIRASDLKPGAWVGLPYGEGFPQNRIMLPDFRVSPPHGNQKRIRTPWQLDEDLALLLGMYASEGHTVIRNHSIHITNSEDAVLEACAALWETCFGIKAKINRPGDRCPSVSVASKTVVEILTDLECGTHAHNKRIPWAVMGSPFTVVAAFLQGLALDAFTSTTGPNALWGICLDSPALLDDLQLLLRWWGLKSGRTPSKYNKQYDKYYDQVTMSGTEAQKFLGEVPFFEPSKTPSAERLLEMTFDIRRNGADVVPLVHGSLLHALIPKGRSGRSGKGTRTSEWRSLCDPRTLWPSRHMVERLRAASIPLPRDVDRVLDERLVFSVVRG